MKGFPLETGCLAPSARTETEKLSKAKRGYAKEEELREQFGAHRPAWGREKARQFRSPDCHEGMGGYWKDGLLFLFLSFCREKRILFFFLTARGQQRSLSWLLFPGERGISARGNVGHTHLGAIHRQRLPWVCPHPIQPPAPRPSLSRPGRPPGQPQSPRGLTPSPSFLCALPPSLLPPFSASSLLRRALPPRCPPSLLSSLLSPRPPSLGAPSLQRGVRGCRLPDRVRKRVRPRPRPPPPAQALAPASPSGGLARSQAGPAPGTGTGPSGATAPVLPRQSGRLTDRSCARIYLAPPRSTREGGPRQPG